SAALTAGIRSAQWKTKPIRHKMIPDTVATAAHLGARAFPPRVAIPTARSTIPRAGAASIRTESVCASHLGSTSRISSARHSRRPRQRAPTPPPQPPGGLVRAVRSAPSLHGHHPPEERGPGGEPTDADGEKRDARGAVVAHAGPLITLSAAQQIRRLRPIA